MKYKLTFALVAALTSTAFAAFQAPLPEFKNEKQLAEWRAEKASEAASQSYAAEDPAFYTGKPYLASSGGYAFKYRSYNPALARWTTEDPSGFPDGANQNFYAPNPIEEIDSNGLAKTKLATPGTPTDKPWQDSGSLVNPLNSNLRTSYQIFIDYADGWTESTIGQVAGLGESLDYTANVGFSSTRSINLGATIGNVDVGVGIVLGGSQSQDVKFTKPATPNVGWEGYVLSISATFKQRARTEIKTVDSNGNFTGWDHGTNDWSTATTLGDGITSTFSKQYYKVE